MELKKFVTKALLDIMEGVGDAQQELYKDGGRDRHKLKGVIVPNGKTSSQVDFTVSVTVEENQASGAQIGVTASIFGGKVEGSSSEAKGQVATLKFSVPVTLPDQNF